MSGTLELSQTLCWVPAGWVYDNVLESIASSIKSAEIRTQLLCALTEVNGGYLDLQSCQYSNLKLIQQGLSSVITKTMDAGPKDLNEPSFFEGYVTQLEELQNLLSQRINELARSALKQDQ